MNTMLATILTILVFSSSAMATPHDGLVRHHRVLYRHHSVRVDQVGVQFSPLYKQKGWVIYAPGMMPPTPSMIVQAEQEICAAITSEDMPHDKIVYPLVYHVYQWEDVDVLKMGARQVASGDIASCL